MNWLRKLLKLTIFLCIFTVLLVISGFAWLVNSEKGLQQIVEQVQQFLPGELKIGKIQGRLIDDCSLSDIYYNYQDMTVKIDSLQLMWRATDLWDKILNLTLFHVDGLTIHLPPSQSYETTEKKETTPIKLPNINLPINLMLGNVKITRMAIETDKDAPVVIDSIILSDFTTEINKLSISYLKVKSPQFNIALTQTKLGLQTPHPLETQAEWLVNLPDSLIVAGKGDIGGNSQEFTLHQTLHKPIVLQLQTTVKDALDQLRWTAELKGESLHFPFDVQKTSDYLVNATQTKIEASGTLQTYQIMLDTNLIGKQIPKGHWIISAKGDTQQVTVEKVQAEWLAGILHATGKIAWLPAISAEFQLRGDKISPKAFWQEWQDNLRINTQLIAELHDKKFKINQLNIELPKTATKINLQGTGLLSELPQLQMTATWQKLQFPLDAKSPIISSNQGQLMVEGTPKDYKLRLNAEIGGKDIPKGRWQVIGQGNSESVQLSQLQGDILQGTVNLNSKFAWKPYIDWQTTLTANQINPGNQWQEWPGKLDINLVSTGSIKNGVLSTYLDIKQLNGKLRNYPVNLQTIASMQGEKYRVDNLLFQSGTTRLTAEGELDQNKLAANWTINAPNLATLLPQAKGSLQGKGSLSGSPTLPHVIATLQGKALSFQENSLGSLHADVNVNLSSGKDVKVEVVATELKQDTKQIDRLQVQGQGELAAHTITLQAKKAKDNLTLQLQGGFDPKQTRWQGLLQQFSLYFTDFGKWQLVTPASLSLSPKQAELTALCLQNTKTANVCTSLNWQDKVASSLQVNLTKIPLNIAKAFFHKDFDITGFLEGQIGAHLQANGRINADSIITISPGSIKTHLVEEDVLPLVYQGGTVRLQVNDKGLSTQVKFDLLEHSGLQGTLELPRLNQLPFVGEQPLQGQVQATFADLASVAALVPAVSNVKGAVQMEVTLGGVLTAPQVHGQLKVENAATDLPDLGLQLKELNLLIADKQPNELHMQASVQSGKGKLQLQGVAQFLANNQFETNLRITGENVEVINTPSVYALASPAIDIQIIPGNVNVSGTLRIPEATITPTDISSAVTTSEDVAIVNPRIPQETKTVTDNANKWAISSEVQISLGEKVTFKGKGFNSRLGGALWASNQPHKVTTGNGELQIIEGTYKAYGQNLKIERGRVIFADGPIDNPGLDIRAFRKLAEVTAGLHIQGTAQSPQLSLYSEPSMDQTDILSYIVLGKPAHKMAGGEKQSLVAMASSLSLGQGEGFTKKLGEQLGLDELTIADSTKKDSTGNSSVQEAALVVGKYLSPELYVSYGIGLFDNSNVLRIRYELTKWLMLETETGTQSGIDLRYTLEK